HSSCLCLFELYQKSLKFRCVGIRINDRRREQIDDCPGNLALVFLNATIPLMNGNPNLVRFLSVNHHGLDALGDESLCLIRTARTGDPEHVTASDSPFVS